MAMSGSKQVWKLVEGLKHVWKLDEIHGNSAMQR